MSEGVARECLAVDGAGRARARDGLEGAARGRTSPARFLVHLLLGVRVYMWPRAAVVHTRWRAKGREDIASVKHPNLMIDG